MTQSRLLDDQVKVIKLDPVEGHPCVLTKVSMPHMFSKRSMLTTHYSSKETDYPLETMGSCWGNQKLLLQYRKEIDDDVSAFIHLNYIKAWQDENNPNVCQWLSLFCIDMKGILSADDQSNFNNKAFHNQAEFLIKKILQVGR